MRCIGLQQGCCGNAEERRLRGDAGAEGDDFRNGARGELGVNVVVDDPGLGEEPVHGENVAVGAAVGMWFEQEVPATSEPAAQDRQIWVYGGEASFDNQGGVDISLADKEDVLGETIRSVAKVARLSSNWGRIAAKSVGKIRIVGPQCEK